MKSVLLLLRPHQWLKNLFIFLPLFFAGQLLNWTYLYPTLVAFVAYSFAASAIYCFNDIWDMEADKLHPKKCKRPIASGRMSVRSGYLIMASCLLISFLLLSKCERRSYLFAIVGFYFVMNIAYCIFLKRIALIDVFIIALGFVLRILVGGVVTGIPLSHWIVLMTFLLALFLAFAKRRDDVVIYEDTGVKARKNINRYSLPFMNQSISIIASITMVCYIMYTVSEEVISRIHSPYLYLTSAFVLLGLLRYLQLTVVDVKSGSPTQILMKDKFIQICILSWIAAFFVILYI